MSFYKLALSAEGSSPQDRDCPDRPQPGIAKWGHVTRLVAPEPATTSVLSSPSALPAFPEATKAVRGQKRLLGTGLLQRRLGAQEAACLHAHTRQGQSEPAETSPRVGRQLPRCQASHRPSAPLPHWKVTLSALAQAWKPSGSQGQDQRWEAGKRPLLSEGAGTEAKARAASHTCACVSPEHPARLLRAGVCAGKY